MHDVLAGVEAHSDAARNVDLNALGPEHDDEVEGSVDICVKAGDVVLGDNRVLHGARRNASEGRRTVITIW
jgi:ectoine hydroxylase-related dioxygenase (phytanoyl-CoA dioxygenase family)|eukprot:COSAG06_NODE_7774_length_2379_cov_71.232018_1_plen_71_part_00